jgi:hypothetical protein
MNNKLFNMLMRMRKPAGEKKLYVQIRHFSYKGGGNVISHSV